MRDISAVYSQPSLGVLVAAESIRELDTNFHRELALQGQHQQLRVIFFEPHRIHSSLRTVQGWVYDASLQSWRELTAALPRLIYDRLFYRNAAHQRSVKPILCQLRRRQRFLSAPLPSKWNMHRYLKQIPNLKAHLPWTVLLKETNTWLSKLESEGSVFIKPASGSQGKGVARILAVDGGYDITGRNKLNAPFQAACSSIAELTAWIRQFAGARPYLVQQALSLTSQSGHAFDLRVLVQKNHQGRWAITGKAIRKGLGGSVTANISGGGQAQQVTPFLINEYGVKNAEAAVEHLAKLSLSIPPWIEMRYGQLAELGLDFGIDQEARIWLIEINSKPGRSIFQQLGDAAARSRSIAAPIEYAKYVLDRRLGGTIHEFENLHRSVLKT